MIHMTDTIINILVLFAATENYANTGKETIFHFQRN